MALRRATSLYIAPLCLTNKYSQDAEPPCTKTPINSTAGVGGRDSGPTLRTRCTSKRTPTAGVQRSSVLPVTGEVKGRSDFEWIWRMCAAGRCQRSRWLRFDADNTSSNLYVISRDIKLQEYQVPLLIPIFLLYTISGDLVELIFGVMPTSSGRTLVLSAAGIGLGIGFLVQKVMNPTFLTRRVGL